MRRWSPVVVVCVAMVLGACGGHRTPTSPGPPPTDSQAPPPEPAPPPPPPTLKITRILAFGDSLTYGVAQPAVALRAYDAGLSVSYPYKLQELETARYTAQTISVTNAGIAGNKALEDRARLTHEVNVNHPEVLLLMEGTNDLGLLAGTSNTAIRTGITTIVNAMEDMVRDAQYQGVAVFVATLPPQRPGGLRAAGASLVDPYNVALRAMVQKKGATLVDINAQLPLALIGQDGLHPTEEGYQKMAEIFQAAIAAAYEVPPATSGLSLH